VTALRRGLAAIVVLALAALPAGCGGDDEDATRAGTATTPAATAPSGQSTTTSTVVQAPRTGRERITECLKKEGYRLQGGPPQDTDTESAEHQIIFSGPRGGGYIGFYKNTSRAKRVLTQLRKNAQRTSGAAVERNGAINIVWIDLPDQGARRRVRDCLVT
jgi:hypothetical protein